MKNWKTFATSFSLLALALVFPIKTSQGCAGGYEGPWGYYFLSHDLADEKYAFTPYIVLQGNEHLTDEAARDAQRIENLKEWSSFACETDNLDDIDAVIYTSSASDLEILRRAAREKKISGRWAKNSFAKGLVESKCTETFDYLIFAKHCEPHAIAGSAWDAEKPFNKDIQELIDLGKKQMLQTDNHFLRLRYMYQIVRLAHYGDNYDYALELYKDLDYKVDEVPSLINWWLLGHKAGCLKRLGRNAEAAYLFSKVFKNSVGKREQVFRSFYIDSDKEWKDCLKFCQNDEERSTLYVMRAMNENSKVVEEMENIYRLFPESADLTPLLIKEISLIENVFTGADFRRNNLSYLPEKPDKVANQRLIRLQTFVKKALEEGKIKDIPTWTVLEGYLEYLAGDLYAAKQTYAKAEALVGNDKNLKEQLELFELIHEIHAMKNMNPENEKRIYEIINRSRFYKSVETLPDFINERIATLYEKQGDAAKAHLSSFGLESLKENPNINLINDMIVLAEKPNKDKLEEYLLEERLSENYKSELYELKGTVHLSRYELSEANQAFRKVNPSFFDEKEKYSPYYLPLKDCIHCEVIDTNQVTVNKKELVEQLLDFEYKAKTDMENSAKYYYILGSAFYNMSYYGHEYEILDNYRHSWNWMTSPEEMEKEVEKHRYADMDYMDVSKALFFFDKARDLAKDDELGARASFMAAKCELANFYQDNNYKYEDSYLGNAPSLPEKYSNYYDLLIKKYAKTDFYQKAIQECKFFSLYVEKKMR